MLVVGLQTGLRASELTGLRNQDIELGTGAHLRCWGKGRKERATPLRPRTVSVLHTWMKERAGRPEDPLFPTRQGTPLSRDALGAIVAKHSATAALSEPSLADKKTTPHTIRHSCAITGFALGSTEWCSPFGWATNRSRRSRCTCTLISRSKSER